MTWGGEGGCWAKERVLGDERKCGIGNGRAKVEGGRR
jgi:hypothetical protein